MNRFDVAARMAPIVRTGAPFLGADLDRIARATTDDERLLRAAVLMLRWPGLHPYVPPDPSRRDRTASGMARVQQLDGNWWCTLARVSRDFPRDLYQTLESDHLQFLVERRVEPLFLTAADRDALVEELSALENVGGHTNYFAPIVLRRARTHPDDPDVPEALARIVRGARYGDCRDEDAVRYARRAFQLLHQQYPRSVWAKRTPYWYR